MIKHLAGVGIAVLVLAGAPKETLRVVVGGSGTVTSAPAGIDCKPACALHVKKGARVKLTASPKRGAVFSRWSKPCGTSRTCTLKMTRSRTMHAYFEPAHAPPPPPPPPPARAGHYRGTYSDGTTFDFDVQGTTMTNLAFDFNGDCSNGGTQSGPLTRIDGTFPIGPDGSVSGHITLTYGNSAGAADFTGTFTPAGSGSGTLKVSLTFPNGGPTCTSSGTWTAQTP